MRRLALLFPSAKSAYLLVLASFTPSSETCRRCQVWAHAQVSDKTQNTHVLFLMGLVGFWEVGLDPETGRVVGLF
jgi:hypothetical protein